MNSVPSMKTPADALRWALTRIANSTLGQGDYFSRATDLLAELEKRPEGDTSNEDRDLKYTVKLEQEFSALEARHGALHAALRKIAISDFKEEMRDEAMSAIEADTPRKESA